MEPLFQDGETGQAAILASLGDKPTMALEGPSDHEGFRKYCWPLTHRLQELSDKVETVPLVEHKIGEMCSLHEGKSIEK